MFIFSYKEKLVISQKHLNKCLKSSFDGKMIFKFQLLLLTFIISFKERQIKQFLEN